MTLTSGNAVSRFMFSGRGTSVARALLTGAVCFAALGSSAAKAQEDRIERGTYIDNTPKKKSSITAIKVGNLYTGNGKTIAGAVMLVEGGKLKAFGADVAVPEGAEVVNLPRGSITPGLIDANALVESQDIITRPRRAPSALALMFHDQNEATKCLACTGLESCALAAMHENFEEDQICPCCGFPSFNDIENMISGVDTQSWSQVEGSSEVVPHTRVIDAVNLRSPDFDRLVRGGVTTIFISPDSSAVIGPRGAVVRTAGPMRDRIEEIDGAVQATMGSDSFNVGSGNAPPFRTFVTNRTRRPNTRMGVTWVFRKAFYDTVKWEAGEVPTGADTPPLEAFPALKEIKEGTIPLRVQARQQSDILAALRLSDELGLKFTLLEGTEAHRCVQELKATGTPVIYGPIYMTPTGLRLQSRETDNTRLSTLRDLLDAGIETALSAQDLREEDGLARQAMYAMRAGLTREEALKAVTITPAKMLGIDGVTGSLEIGKRADLIVWSGEPFDATSRPVVVMVGGKMVYDGRETK